MKSIPSSHPHLGSLTIQGQHGNFLLQGSYYHCWLIPSMPEIKGLTDDVLKYFDTSEGKEVLMLKEASKSNFLHKGLSQAGISKMVEIYGKKLPYVILKRLGCGSSEGWVPIDSRFVDFYMTLLATRLAEGIGAGILTYELMFDELATVVRIDAPLSTQANRQSLSRLRNTVRNSRRRTVPPTIAQRMLANLIIEQIEIDPDTPVKKILHFRTKHADELGHFRAKIAELTVTISEDQPPERLRQQVQDIYINEVRPAINSMKAGLTDSMISWGAKNILTIAGLSTSSLALLTLLHLAAPYTLLVDAGISLTASVIQYNRERAEKLRQNPYSFVLTAEKAFPRNGS